MSVPRIWHAAALSEPDRASPLSRGNRILLLKLMFGSRVQRGMMAYGSERLLSSWLRCILKWNMFE